MVCCPGLVLSHVLFSKNLCGKQRISNKNIRNNPGRGTNMKTSKIRAKS